MVLAPVMIFNGEAGIQIVGLIFLIVDIVVISMAVRDKQEHKNNQKKTHARVRKHPLDEYVDYWGEIHNGDWL